MEQTLDIDAVRAIEEACRASRPRPQHPDLLGRLAQALPQHGFEYRFARYGWFRPGGLITPTGEPITDDLMGWAEAAWALADEDGARLMAACRGEADEADLRFEIGLTAHGEAPIATRFAGITHYFVARYGNAPESFLQLEVEEMREVTSHRLGESGPPDSIEDLVAAPRKASEGRPVGMPVYRLRRVNDMARVVARMSLQLAGETAGALRFIADWARCRAANEAMCEHWLMQISAWSDRFGVERIGIKPAAVRERMEPPAPDMADAAQMANTLGEYDRRAGYPMAWFFNLVTGRGVPEQVAHQVLEQWQQGFRYLPERDMACVTDYCRKPYRA